MPELQKPAGAPARAPDCESLGADAAKAVFGVLIWAIASEKSAVEESGKLLPH